MLLIYFYYVTPGIVFGHIYSFTMLYTYNCKHNLLARNCTYLKYIYTFEKGGRFLTELKDFRKNKTSIVEMESWLASLQNHEL